jgi:serine/threonine protein kinase
MEASESVLRAGYRLDRYELLCPIASGGMATVWLARLRGKRGFEKLFAIKTIRTELVDDAQFQEMFLDEARITSGIQHPNVAQILDLGDQADVLFIVMEWVDGDSLAKIRRLLAKREVKLPVGVVLRVLADACAGLHAAHELRDDRGEPLEIVHRDVSPHNILLSVSGAVKVIDFGIAKSQNRQQGETRTGIVKGKIQYMAPEQVKKAGTADRRADVWALGMCLHELLVGKLPYGGEDDIGVIRRLMADEAPAISPDLPQAIVRVLERSVVLDPDARFPTAAGMQRALEGAMKELGEAASSEDVAGFLRAELPELARNRREAVTKAIENARERGTLNVESGDEAAFAPTVVSDRDPRARGREEARAIALTKRKEPPSALAPAISLEDSRVTPSAALEQEPITIPKRSRAWLWGTLLLVGAAVGAGVMWPAAASRVLATLGWRVSASQALPPETSPERGVATPAASDGVLRAVAPAAAIARVNAGGTMDSSLGADVPPAVSVRPPIDTVPPHLSPPHGSVSPAGAPGEVPDALVPVPGTSAAPAPAPTDVEDDPNNPYND